MTLLLAAIMSLSVACQSDKWLAEALLDDGQLGRLSAWIETNDQLSTDQKEVLSHQVETLVTSSLPGIRAALEGDIQAAQDRFVEFREADPDTPSSVHWARGGVPEAIERRDIAERQAVQVMLAGVTSVLGSEQIPAWDAFVSDSLRVFVLLKMARVGHRPVADLDQILRTCSPQRAGELEVARNYKADLDELVPQFLAVREKAKEDERNAIGLRATDDEAWNQRMNQVRASYHQIAARIIRASALHAALIANELSEAEQRAFSHAIYMIEFPREMAPSIAVLACDSLLDQSPPDSLRVAIQGVRTSVAVELNALNGRVARVVRLREEEPNTHNVELEAELVELLTRRRAASVRACERLTVILGGSPGLDIPPHVRLLLDGAHD